MATTTQLALPTRTAGAVALWHLLSLDAPTVAALWTWFIARACHLVPPFAALAAMVLAVWMLYAADRLLDARLLDDRLLDARSPNHPYPHPSQLELEARHRFHHLHRRAFLTGITLAALALAALLPALNGAAIRLYLVEGALLVAWFIILHASRSAHRLPKEIAVGFFFSAAVFIPTISRQPALRASLLPCAILFAALCSLNCLFIYAWEHGPPRAATAQPPHATTRLALAHLPALAVALTLGCVAVALLNPAAPRSLPEACALSALLLLVLHCHRHRFSRIHLRAVADLALLTPALLLPFLLFQ